MLYSYTIENGKIYERNGSNLLVFHFSFMSNSFVCNGYNNWNVIYDIDKDMGLNMRLKKCQRMLKLCYSFYGV